MCVEAWCSHRRQLQEAFTNQKHSVQAADQGQSAAAPELRTCQTLDRMCGGAGSDHLHEHSDNICLYSCVSNFATRVLGFDIKT